MLEAVVMAGQRRHAAAVPGRAWGALAMEAEADAVPTPAHREHPVRKAQLLQLHELIACTLVSLGTEMY